MGEIIQIHVGQAGVQIANACWELYCLEHGIGADGTLCECPSDDTFRNFFSFKDAEKVVPRTVLVDSEPTVIDQIRTGPYGRLYNPATLITGKEDSGSNFARGYYTMGAEMIDLTMDSIRLVADSCCNLRGFLIFRSIGGGTGSGFGNLIAEQLKDDYDRVSKLEFVIFPSPSISPLIVEPYNALLATHLGMDSIECTFILDNEALYDICAANLNICSPKYKNLNRIIGQIVSTFTTSQRFLSNSSVSFTEFQTNLVPYPRIHFPVVSYAPFIAGTGLGYTNFTTEQITNACFDPCSQLVRCNPTEGKFMSCVLLYRGQVSSSYINYSLSQLRNSRTVRFVDWQPTGFKVGISTEPPFTVPCGGLSNSNKALLTLSNNTIIHKTWCRLMSKYDRLLGRRAFIHHYEQEGLEEESLREAADDICALIADYKEVDEASASEEMTGNENSYGEYVEDKAHSRSSAIAWSTKTEGDGGLIKNAPQPTALSRKEPTARDQNRNVSDYGEKSVRGEEPSNFNKRCGIKDTVKQDCTSAGRKCYREIGHERTKATVDKPGRSAGRSSELSVRAAEPTKPTKTEGLSNAIERDASAGRKFSGEIGQEKTKSTVEKSARNARVSSDLSTSKAEPARAAETKRPCNAIKRACTSAGRKYGGEIGQERTKWAVEKSATNAGVSSDLSTCKAEPARSAESERPCNAIKRDCTSAGRKCAEEITPDEIPTSRSSSSSRTEPTLEKAEEPNNAVKRDCESAYTNCDGDVRYGSTNSLTKTESISGEPVTNASDNGNELANTEESCKPNCSTTSTGIKSINVFPNNKCCSNNQTVPEEMTPCRRDIDRLNKKQNVVSPASTSNRKLPKTGNTAPTTLCAICGANLETKPEGMTPCTTSNKMSIKQDNTESMPSKVQSNPCKSGLTRVCKTFDLDDYDDSD